MSAGAVRLDMSFDSPAQPDEQRFFDLAGMQIQAFFYMLTYDEAAQRGYCWPGVFAPIVITAKSDWGNPLLLWVRHTADDWEWRLHANAADGFYRLWIRRTPETPVVWAWALEWNMNYRLAGFFGDEASIRVLHGEAPKLPIHTIFDEPGRVLRMRTEIALDPDNDDMFARPE